jgi:thiol-disulfide isomerase/thioredoxin
MMAPVYKTLAKEYEGKAVFVKVDTATNRQLQSTYQVNSIPTFLFFGADGKKKNQFSGAGEGQLRQLTKEVVADAERLNVKLTLESLVDYYATHEPSKAAEDVAELHAKCAKMAKGADCEGGAAADLAGKLKKKYKAKPGLSSRFGDASGGANDNKEPPKKAEAKARRQQPEAGTFRGARGAASEASQQPPPAAAVPAGPQLELASLAELEAAVKQRRSDLGLPPPEAAAASAANGGSSTANDEDEDEEDDEEDDDEDLIDPKTPWVEHGGIDRVAILGGGPAGLAAAVYAARAGLKPVVVAPPFGGQLMGKGVDVENYPGLVGQTGPSMVTLMQKQAVSFGTLFLEQTVVKAELSPSSSSGGQPIVLHTNHTSLKCHTLIVATGADSKWLGVPGEWSFRGGGVSTCATCDGFLFRDKPVVVVGGGDTAMEDALVLARTSSEVRNDRSSIVLLKLAELYCRSVLVETVLPHSSGWIPCIFFSFGSASINPHPCVHLCR